MWIHFKLYCAGWCRQGMTVCRRCSRRRSPQVSVCGYWLSGLCGTAGPQSHEATRSLFISLCLKRDQTCNLDLDCCQHLVRVNQTCGHRSTQSHTNLSFSVLNLLSVSKLFTLTLPITLNEMPIPNPKTQF